MRHDASYCLCASAHMGELAFSGVQCRPWDA